MKGLFKPESAQDKTFNLIKNVYTTKDESKAEVFAHELYTQLTKQPFLTKYIINPESRNYIITTRPDILLGVDTSFNNITEKYSIDYRNLWYKLDREFKQKILSTPQFNVTLGQQFEITLDSNGSVWTPVSISEKYQKIITKVYGGVTTIFHPVRNSEHYLEVLLKSEEHMKEKLDLMDYRKYLVSLNTTENIGETEALLLKIFDSIPIIPMAEFGLLDSDIEKRKQLIKNVIPALEELINHEKKFLPDVKFLLTELNQKIHTFESNYLHNRWDPEQDNSIEKIKYVLTNGKIIIPEHKTITSLFPEIEVSK